MNAWISGTLLVGIAIVSGCDSSDKSKFDYRPTGDQAANIPLDKSKFELEKDPPYTAQTRFAAGVFAESEKRLPQAIEQYQQALKIDPKHEQSLYHLALVYTETKQYDEAEAAWKSFIKVTKKPATGYSNLAFCYEMAGDNDKAEEAYKKGISIDSKSEPCRVKYGLMLARHDHMEDAITQWKMVLTPAQVQYNVGAVLELRGHKSEARAAYEEALVLQPDFKDAQKRLDRLNGAARIAPPSSIPQSNTAVAVPAN